MAGLRARKKLKVRRDLVTAALRLFDERGSDATTIDDIVDAADVSRRTFFRYFRSKDDVYLVDPERTLAIIRAELRARHPGEPILDAIRRTLAAIARDYAADAELARLQYVVGLKEPRLAAHGYVYQVRWEDALTDAVAADTGENPATGGRSRVVAHVTVGAVRSALSAWLAGDGTADPVGIMMDTFDMVGPALAVLLSGAGTAEVLSPQG